MKNINKGKVKRNICIASDHAGYELKEFLKERFKQDFSWIDFGCFGKDSVDYPDFIHPLAKEIDEGLQMTGVIICGSGIGVSMVANKYKKVRAALCWNKEIAKLSRQHNNANVLALPARFISNVEASEITEIFMTTAFEGGRHAIRVEKI